MEVKSYTHAPLLKTVGTIFFVLFLNISLSSLVQTLDLACLLCIYYFIVLLYLYLFS